VALEFSLLQYALVDDTYHTYTEAYYTSSLQEALSRLAMLLAVKMQQ